jgi:hypothetical protein
MPRFSFENVYETGSRRKKSAVVAPGIKIVPLQWWIIASGTSMPALHFSTNSLP